MLDDASLRERAADLVERLSGGLRQRVNVAVGLLGDPALVLLDEPSASLDPRQRERLWAFLERRAAARHGAARHDARRRGGLAPRRPRDRARRRRGAVRRRARELPRARDEADFEAALVRFLEEHGH